MLVKERQGKEKGEGGRRRKKRRERGSKGVRGRAEGVKEGRIENLA